MRHIRVYWNAFKTVALMISFTVNMVLLVVLLILMMQIFHIKNGILEPLIDGLHTNFVGMDGAVIERTIEVEDVIPVQFDLPLNQATNGPGNSLHCPTRWTLANVSNRQCGQAGNLLGRS